MSDFDHFNVVVVTLGILLGIAIVASGIVVASQNAWHHDQVVRVHKIDTCKSASPDQVTLCIKTNS